MKRKPRRPKLPKGEAKGKIVPIAIRPSPSGFVTPCLPF